MTAIARRWLAMFAIALAAPAAAQQDASSRAIYYTQPSAGSAPTPVTGSVVWRRVERDDGTAAIAAIVEFADPAIGFTISVSRNTDNDLQASHIIAIAFEDPATLSETGIESIPAFVAKLKLAAPGRPFIGAGVAVTDTLFWIGLSSKHVENNIALLRAGRWFDMPVRFKDKKRALFTLETGPGGRQVIDEVMATWPTPAAAN